MSKIEALKNSSAAPLKNTVDVFRMKSDSSNKLGAFSKLLSSATKEKSVEPKAETEELLKDIEAAVTELQQTHPEDLQPEQQELLATLEQILSLYLKPVAKNSELTSLNNENTKLNQQSQQEQALSGSAGDQLLKEKLIGLMDQVMQNAQSRQTGTAKEFVNAPNFMGGEMEKDFKNPNKINEVLNLLMAAAENLDTMKTQDRVNASSKLLDNVQELLHLFSGTLKEIEVSAEPRKQELPTLTPKTNIQLLAETSTGNAEPAPTIASDSTKAAQASLRPEPSAAPAPIVRLATMAADLGTIIGSSAKFSGTGESAQLKVSIFPEHLGHLDIRLSTVDGKIAAQILTSNPMAKEALELQINQLRNSLIQQGLQVDRIEVTTQQQSGQSLTQQQSQQEQRFTRQQKSSATSKNGYEQSGDETTNFVREDSPLTQVMAIDYTI